jgi:hypothetical protein
MIAQGEDEKRRLRVQLVAGTNTAPATRPATCPTPATRPVPVTRPGPVKKEVPKEKIDADNQAIAVAHPEYPDTYELTVNGVKKGFAAVQDMDLSKRLKLLKGEIRVKIEWNPEFSMYEIHDIL